MEEIPTLSGVDISYIATGEDHDVATTRPFEHSHV